MASILITASFDVNQTSDALTWTITNSGGSVDPGSGTLNGLYDLSAGDTVAVQACATSVNPSVGVIILECNLVSRPMLFPAGGTGIPGTYPFPSPFFDVNGEPPLACTVNSVLPFVSLIPGPDGVQLFNSQALTVNCAGRWEISLLMTVAITKTVGASAVTNYRVFGFDPESDVTSGAVPPP